MFGLNHFNISSENSSPNLLKICTLVNEGAKSQRVQDSDGEAFVANFPLPTNEHYSNKEGEEVSKTEWQHSVVYDVTFISATYSRSMCNCVYKV